VGLWRRMLHNLSPPLCTRVDPKFYLGQKMGLSSRRRRSPYVTWDFRRGEVYYKIKKSPARHYKKSTSMYSNLSAVKKGRYTQISRAKKEVYRTPQVVLTSRSLPENRRKTHSADKPLLKIL
jgi:hypothetical protein